MNDVVTSETLNTRVEVHRLATDPDPLFPMREVDEYADVSLAPVDFNDDQDPRVAINIDDRHNTTMFCSANGAEHLAVLLILTAAVSRKVEPGGPVPVLPESIRRLVMSEYAALADKLTEMHGASADDSPD